jgi:hypothetical protein
MYDMYGCIVNVVGPRIPITKLWSDGMQSIQQKS